MVLLKNEPAASSGQDQKPMLPLDAATAGTVAVIGPHSTDYYGKEIGYYYFGAHGCMPVCGTNSTNQVRETDTLRERERGSLWRCHTVVRFMQAATFIVPG